MSDKHIRESSKGKKPIPLQTRKSKLEEDSSDLEQIKDQILVALKHPEAQDGLYFRNFQTLHEEDERPAVEAAQVDLLDALVELMGEGKIRMDDAEKEVIFHIA